MQKIVLFLLFFGLYFGTVSAVAQQKPQKVAKVEDKDPALFDYEPDFLAAERARRAEIDSIIRIIDTLDISENKRLKLIKDLYRNKRSKRLNKILLADTKFVEDIEE